VVTGMQCATPIGVAHSPFFRHFLVCGEGVIYTLSQGLMSPLLILVAGQAITSKYDRNLRPAVHWFVRGPKTENRSQDLCLAQVAGPVCGLVLWLQRPQLGFTEVEHQVAITSDDLHMRLGR
jgi:hypothetical protein